VPILAAFGIGIALVAAFLGLAGYSPVPQEPPIPTTHDYENSLITLRRTACFGPCPDYSLTIHGNGTVLYEGHSHVKIRGNYTYSIPQENVKKLIDNAYYSSGFFSMADSYGGCIDCPTYALSISVDNTTKSVRYLTSAAPDGLKFLDKRVDELAETDRLVKCDAERGCTK